MKIHYTTITILITAALMIAVQFSYGQNSAFYLQAGLRFVETQDVDLSFRFVDESPSMDNLSRDFNVSGASETFVVALGFDSEKENNLYFNLGLEGFFSDIIGGNIDLGMGYSFTFGKLKVRPAGFFSVGLSSLRVGTIENNASFIEINGNQFFGESLVVRVQNIYTAFKPNLGLSFPINSNLSVRLNAGYTAIISTSDGTATFSRDDFREEVDVSEPNLGFEVNGVETDELPIDFDGFYANAGIGFSL